MLSEQSLRDGQLQQALEQLQDQIRKKPAEPEPRIFLFQLLTVLGQWQRALNQLNVIGGLDAGTLPMVQTYRQAIACELLREQVFAGQRAPLVFGDPAQWIALLLEALRLTASGDHARAEAVRNQAFEQAPAAGGTVNDQPFAWLADADVRLGPVLEALINGQYYWIPFDRIASLTLEPPSDLRDLVWLPGQFTWTNGGQVVGLLPARYPGSTDSDDPQIKLGRKTDWQQYGENTFLGLGQKMLATDQGEFALFDIRSLTLAAADG